MEQRISKTIVSNFVPGTTHFKAMCLMYVTILQLYKSNQNSGHAVHSCLHRFVLDSLLQQAHLPLTGYCNIQVLRAMQKNIARPKCSQTKSGIFTTFRVQRELWLLTYSSVLARHLGLRSLGVRFYTVSTCNKVPILTFDEQGYSTSKTPDKLIFTRYPVTHSSGHKVSTACSIQSQYIITS